MKLLMQDRRRLPVDDYSVALRNAVAWLGKRYLLAEPVKARPVDQRPPRYFDERKRWHEGIARDGLRLDH
jgi:hypothetical protein